MASRTSNVACTVVLAGLLALGISACDAPSALAPRHTSGPLAPNFDEDAGDGSTDCPPGVPAWDCVPLTQAERTEIWWDVQQGVKWYIGICASIGSHLQDFVATGDVRKYNRPTFGGPVGFYQEIAPSTGVRQISYDLIYHQGWNSERTRTFLHEGTHSFRNMGSQIDSWDPLGPGAFWVENNCFNW